MGRSGFTDEGGASMMSWLLDSASCTSSQQDRYDQALEDPAYLRYLEGDLGDAEADGQKNGLEVKIAELEAELLEEKRKNRERILLECELACQDQFIEELEGKIEEKQKIICGLEVMLEEEKKKNFDALKCFAVASFSVAVTLAAVLYCVYEKML